MTQANRPRLRPDPRERTVSSGSFHAGASIPTILPTRRGSVHRYQTFPTAPPKTPGERSSGSAGLPGTVGSDDGDSSDDEGEQEPTPLPKRQLLLLALLSLAEQTALNSISPYLPELVANLPDVPEADVGFYVGMLASAFALAQLSSNFVWGYASDVIGRKPVLLAGTFFLMLCFLAFGFCQRYWQVVLVHALMGLLNGNAAAVPTVLGEVTDRSNQSKVFAYLPIVYSLGSITGPAAGGVLAGRLSSRYTYLAPNLFAAALLATSVTVVAIWFEETLNADEAAPELPRWARKLFGIVSRVIAFVGSFFRPCRGRASPRNRSWSSRWPRPQSASGPRQALLSSAASDSSSSSDDEDEESPSDETGEEDDKQGKVWREILNHTTVLLLLTYLLFQLANISFNSLYPIFAAAAAPEGRELDPDQIGVTLSLSGIATMFFQGIVFQPLKARRGNLGTYRLALFGLAVSMFLIPWIGYLNGTPPLGLANAKVWLFVELGLVLIIKNISAVAGLSSVMLLITNSAPSPASLGTLNGLAQTLSALGRSIGPLASGSLFTLARRFHEGGVFVWTLFGGLAILGWICTGFINGRGLESDDYDHFDEGDGDEEEQQP